MGWSDAETRVRELLPELVELRHDLHRHPELGFAERRTQEVARQWLEREGWSVTPAARTGLVADLRPGRPTPVAWRADLDALPMQETTDLPWRSVHDGVAHKCGHDGHTTVGLAVASALAAIRDRIDANVRLLFQPAEEGVEGGGARVLVAEGALEGVDTVYGFHNWPGFPKGQVRVAGGPVMAAVDTLRFRIVGRGGHASQPQVCRDPIVAGAHLVQALQTVVSRGLDYRGGAVLSIGAFVAGDTHNVIPGEARLLGTVRTFDDDLRARVVARIREITAGCAAAFGVEIDLDVDAGFPVLVNDPGCADRVREAAASVFGDDAVGDADLPLAASEDFAYLTAAVPGAYFFVGAGCGDGTPGCHHPDFDFDDDLIEPTARVAIELVRNAASTA